MMMTLNRIHVLAGEAVRVMQRLSDVTQEETEIKNRLKEVLGEIDRLAAGYSPIYEIRTSHMSAEEVCLN
jgi:hypothetical protein